MASHPPPAQALSPRILFALPFPPRLDAPHGGRVIARLILHLARRAPVAVVCIARPGDLPTGEELRAACATVVEVDTGEPRVRGVWRNRLAQARKLVGAPPSIVQESQVEELGPALRRIAEQFGPGVVQLEPYEMAQYLPALDGLPVRRVVVDHDPGLEAARDFAAAAHGAVRLLRGLDVLAWRRYARRAARRLDALVALTERDRAAIAGRAGNARVVVIPFALDLPECASDPVGVEPGRILFFGGYRHVPNADAALRLQRSIFPGVQRTEREARLDLVGGGVTTEMQAATAPGITLHGHLPSIDRLLDEAAVVALPIELGGGMRVKLLESLAAGKAIVASPRAIEGLDLEPGRELVVAATDAEFVEAICALLRDPARRGELGRAARGWAEQNLSWERCAAAYLALYAELGASDG